MVLNLFAPQDYQIVVLAPIKWVEQLSHLWGDAKGCIRIFRFLVFVLAL